MGWYQRRVHGDSTLKMLGKTVVAVLVISLVLVAAMPSKKKRIFKKKEGRTDLVMKSKHHGMEIKQGACPEGWMDGSAAGLGCVWADTKDGNLDVAKEGDFVWP